MRSVAADLRAQGKTIALVATQGALHAGQEALIRAAVQSAQVVIVSIFVNPLQFGPNEVMANYPRSLAEDVALCQRCGAHSVFAPAAEDIYPRGYSTFVTEDSTGKPLDGVSRPNHFRGVATVMAKLLTIVRPTQAFSAKKPPNAPPSYGKWPPIFVSTWKSWWCPRSGRPMGWRRVCGTKR